MKYLSLNVLTILLGLGVLFSCNQKTVKEKNCCSKDSSNVCKKTFVLVHSAWLGAWQWSQVKKQLIEKGHEVITPDLPGHGSDKTPAAEIDMNAYVNKLVQVLKYQDKPVILVGHSFNGITISRVAELQPEKVEKLVYLTAFLLPKGASFFSAVQGVEGSKAVENFYLSEDESKAFVKENVIKEAFAHDISDEMFDKVKGMIVPEPARPLNYELEISEDKFGRIPKYYIECTEDKAIPIEVQRGMYKGNVKQHFSIASSHTPNFSHPSELSNILSGLCKKAVCCSESKAKK